MKVNIKAEVGISMRVFPLSGASVVMINKVEVNIVVNEETEPLRSESVSSRYNVLHQSSRQFISNCKTHSQADYCHSPLEDARPLLPS